jgi:hypothetical protein
MGCGLKEILLGSMKILMDSKYDIPEGCYHVGDSASNIPNVVLLILHPQC